MVKLHLTSFEPHKSKVGRPATHATGIIFQAAVQNDVRIFKVQSPKLQLGDWSSEN